MSCIEFYKIYDEIFKRYKLKEDDEYLRTAFLLSGICNILGGRSKPIDFYKAEKAKGYTELYYAEWRKYNKTDSEKKCLKMLDEKGIKYEFDSDGSIKILRS